MDSFAVSLTYGVGSISLRKFLPIAAVMSVAQGLMPLLGWLIGSAFSLLLQNIAHWIALLLLVFIGMRMVYEAWKRKDDRVFNINSFSVLVLLAIATSIDALIVGIGFGLLQINIILACLIIGLVTFVASLIGGFLGNRGGKYLGNTAELLGGLVLIALGIKIFLEYQ